MITNLTDVKLLLKDFAGPAGKVEIEVNSQNNRLYGKIITNEFMGMTNIEREIDLSDWIDEAGIDPKFIGIILLLTKSEV